MTHSLTLTSTFCFPAVPRALVKKEKILALLEWGDAKLAVLYEGQYSHLSVVDIRSNTENTASRDELPVRMKDILPQVMVCVPVVCTLVVVRVPFRVGSFFCTLCCCVRTTSSPLSIIDVLHSSTNSHMRLLNTHNPTSYHTTQLSTHHIQHTHTHTNTLSSILSSFHPYLISIGVSQVPTNPRGRRHRRVADRAGLG
jgi:hypothetical protein